MTISTLFIIIIVHKSQHSISTHTQRIPPPPQKMAVLRAARVLTWSLPRLPRILCTILHSFVLIAQALNSTKTNHDVSPIFAATTQIVMNTFIPSDLGPDWKIIKPHHKVLNSTSRAAISSFFNTL